MPDGPGCSSRTGMTLVVVGDRGTGKSSLIAAAVTKSVPDNVPPVHPPMHLPPDCFSYGVPNHNHRHIFRLLTFLSKLIDFSPEDKDKLNEELKQADGVVLTYACNQKSSFSRLTSYWIPELRRLEVKVPVVVVGCKLDLRSEPGPRKLCMIMGPIMRKFKYIDTCVLCSATTLAQVPKVFFSAQRAVLNPIVPLVDRDRLTLKPRCVKALKRIFILCDHDMDGALSDAEWKAFQNKCFKGLRSEEILAFNELVKEIDPDGVNDRGLTLDGFLSLYTLFIVRGFVEGTWIILRQFGNGDDLQLSLDFLLCPIGLAPDQRVELTTEAVEFLCGIFRLHDIDDDGAVRSMELKHLFLTAPERQCDGSPYEDAVETTTLGNLTLNGFVSKWVFITLLDPRHSLENLKYVGYSGDPAAALRVTRKRSVDREKQQTSKTIFHCLVFGPKKAGKSALLNSFLKRPFSEDYTPTTSERYAVNVVDQLRANNKTLILHEVPEEGVENILSDQESLADCDVTLFVYDSSDEYSWKRTKELLVEVSRLGEDSGYGVPCLLLASKGDLVPCLMALQDSARVTQEIGIEPSIPVSVTGNYPSNVFSRIIRAAEQPHLNIPRTVTGSNIGDAIISMVGNAMDQAFGARDSSWSNIKQKWE